ncbi:MAG: twin-arginine translocase TatA/TatE family subunit [Candidatus Woesearchaeota archaeon]
MVLGLGPTEIAIVVLIIVVLILGPKKLPQLFRSMGQAIGEFKKGKVETEAEMKKSAKKKTSSKAVKENKKENKKEK